MPSFGLIWTIAAKQLLARRRQATIIVAGIVLGVTVLLATMSLFGGLLETFTAKILDVAPHVTVTAESAEGSESDVLIPARGGKEPAVQLEKNVEKEERTRIRNVMTVLRSIERRYGDDLTAVSPYLSTQALAVYGTNESTLPIKGVMPEFEAEIADLSRYMLSGSVQRLEATRNGILLGKRAAADLGADFGDRVRLISLTGEVFNAQVVGVYNVGIDVADRVGLVNLRMAQSIERALPSEATAIGFQIRDVTKAATIASGIEKLTGKKTETWEETNSGVLSIFQFLRALFFTVVGFVIVICGFGIANILITSVLEKQRDIAVMKSFGFPARAISWMYLFQGLAVAVVGCVLGVLIGAVVVKLMGMIPSLDSQGAIAPVETKSLPVVWNIWYVVLAVASTVIVSTIASVAPARSAARVVPVEVLRGEK